MALAQKVDAFFAQVHQRHGDAMECRAGCSDCCVAGLTVTLVEAAAIARHLLAAGGGLAPHAGPGCAALDGAGQCRIYPARPLVCRSQGVPVRLRDDVTRLPVVTACDKNFPAGTDVIDPLDQETLSTILAAVEAAFCADAGIEPGARISLADLVADPGALFEA